MSRKLKPTEFYEELARRNNIDVKTVQSLWESLDEFIIVELRNYGYIDLPLLGRMRLFLRPEKEYHLPNSERDKIRLNTDEPYRMEVVPEYKQINFKPALTFKEVINDKIELTAVWKRAREEVRKYEEEQRALEEQKAVLERKRNAMNIVREAKIHNIHSRKEFQQLSKKKQQEKIDEESRNKDWEE